MTIPFSSLPLMMTFLIVEARAVSCWGNVRPPLFSVYFTLGLLNDFSHSQRYNMHFSLEREREIVVLEQVLLKIM